MVMIKMISFFVRWQGRDGKKINIGKAGTRGHDWLVSEQWGGNMLLPVEMFHRWKCFTGGNVSPEKMYAMCSYTQWTIQCTLKYVQCARTKCTLKQIKCTITQCTLKCLQGAGVHCTLYGRRKCKSLLGFFINHVFLVFQCDLGHFRIEKLCINQCF